MIYILCTWIRAFISGFYFVDNHESFSAKYVWRVPDSVIVSPSIAITTSRRSKFGLQPVFTGHVIMPTIKILIQQYLLYIGLNVVEKPDY